jgi:hypothetical protein
MSSHFQNCFQSILRSRSRSVKRTTLVSITIVTAGLLFASVALAQSSPLAPSGSRSSDASATTTSTWTTPENELEAPSVPTPGGAVEGSGAFNAVTCPASSVCVAVGGDSNLSGIAATSDDDGGTWTASMVPTGLPEMKSVSCSSSDHCVAVGNGVAIVSNDGGVTWSANSIPTDNTALLGVSCANGTSTCVAVGAVPNDGGPLNGAIITSNDGGDSWSVPTATFPLGAIGGVSCASSSFCVAVGAQILVTDDGGATWTQQFIDGAVGVLRTVSCGSPTTCVAIGANPVGADQKAQAGFEIQSTDGGAKWSTISLPTGSWVVNALSCSDDSNCVLSGPSLSQSTAPLWRSTDGGSTWSATTLPLAVSAIGSLSCVTASLCVYVGLAGSSPTSGSSSGDSTWTSNPIAAFSSVQGSAS